MSQYFILSILFISLFFSCVQINEEKAKEDSVVNEALFDYDVEEKVSELGIVLKEPTAPVANYVNSVRSGNLIFLAGKGPTRADGTRVTGKVGADLTIEEGYEAARLVAEAQLSALKSEIDDLNKVVQIIKVLGMVNCTSEFGNQPEVVNGFSDVMVEVFGDRGKHARAAVGMGSLPRNIAVEIEMIVEVRD
ncbi:MAG: RidA family protein [Bacteroidota bacterium]